MTPIFTALGFFCIIYPILKFIQYKREKKFKERMLIHIKEMEAKGFKEHADIVRRVLHLENK